MTLIIGTKCMNGVVIGSDAKVMRGGEVEYGNKIFEENNVVFAVEGLTGIRDDFLLLLNNEIRNRKGLDTLYEMKVIVEDIIAVLSERYEKRIGQESSIGALMGGLENITTGKAKLYYIPGVGYGEATNFLCTCHGGTYATSIAKFLCRPDLSIKENAHMLAYVISWVSEDVDTTVGGTPQIAMIEDTKGDIGYLDNKSIEKMMRYAQDTKKDLKNIFKLEDISRDERNKKQIPED